KESREKEAEQKRKNLQNVPSQTVGSVGAVLPQLTKTSEIRAENAEPLQSGDELFASPGLQKGEADQNGQEIIATVETIIDHNKGVCRCVGPKGQILPQTITETEKDSKRSTKNTHGVESFSDSTSTLSGNRPFYPTHLHLQSPHLHLALDLETYAEV